MTATIGTLFLCTALLAVAATLLACLAAARFQAPALVRFSRAGLALIALLLTGASIALAIAMVRSDFSISYVASYTEKALPTAYKLVAFWAGQPGSLLLWAWLLAILAVLFALHQRKEYGLDHVVALATLALVIGFFIILMLAAKEADPFRTLARPAEDGRGLNPMLQDPGMIAHPPILFVGYAGFTIPFALLFGALIARRTDNHWINVARPWALISWLFLGVGIILGAEWAYTELGWGGYWAWDPVENASLLPWLTGTALLHSIIAQRQQGVLKRWTALLAASTFILCIFGTYITRSGVVDSVHTFGKSAVGTLFGGFLILCTLSSLLLIAWRWSALYPERRFESPVSREAGFLAAIVLLVLMMATTLLGTMLPAITKAMGGQAQSANINYYTWSVLPPGLLLALIMGLAPLLVYGKSEYGRLLRGLGVPLAMAAATLVGLGVVGFRSPWAMAAGAVAAVVVGGIGVDLIGSILARRQAGGPGMLLSALRLIDSNHRRYGAQVAHLGVAMMIVGMAGSSLYGVKENLQLAPGSSKSFGHYSLRLDNLEQTRGENYLAIQANLSVSHQSGPTELLQPQRRVYDKWQEQTNAKVALRSNLREDLYVTLVGCEPDGSLATFQVIVSPLVWWIWAGGVVLSLGALFCLVPRLLPAGAEVQAAPKHPARRARACELVR